VLNAKEVARHASMPDHFLLHFNAAKQQYFDFSYSTGAQTFFARLI